MSPGDPARARLRAAAGGLARLALIAADRAGGDPRTAPALAQAVTALAVAAAAETPPRTLTRLNHVAGLLGYILRSHGGMGAAARSAVQAVEGAAVEARRARAGRPAGGPAP